MLALLADIHGNLEALQACLEHARGEGATRYAPPTRRWLAIVGSAGQPRERNPAAAYARFDSVRERITFERVPYDHLAAARKVRAAGLPDLFAGGAR